MSYIFVCSGLPYEITNIISEFTHEKAINSAQAISNLLSHSSKFNQSRNLSDKDMTLFGLNNIEGVEIPEYCIVIFTRKYTKAIFDKAHPDNSKIDQFLKDLSVQNNSGNLYDVAREKALSTILKNCHKVINRLVKYKSFNKTIENYNTVNQENYPNLLLYIKQNINKFWLY